MLRYLHSSKMSLKTKNRRNHKISMTNVNALNFKQIDFFNFDEQR